MSLLHGGTVFVIDDIDPAAQVANHTKWQGLRQDIGRVAGRLHLAHVDLARFPSGLQPQVSDVDPEPLASGVVDHSLVVRHQRRQAPYPQIGQPTLQANRLNDRRHPSVRLALPAAERDDLLLARPEASQCATVPPPIDRLLS